MRRTEIEAAGLPVLLHSDDVGAGLVEDPDHRALYVFNHLEYDNGTLNEEYRRDLESAQIDGAPVRMPLNYFPEDDPTRPPPNRWRSQAHLLYGNWLSEVYLTTPFEIERIGETSSDRRREE
jgi:homoserine O-succinyltransferase